MLTTPTIESIPAAGGVSPQFDAQATTDSTDLAALTNAESSISGVASGCLVTAASIMAVNVASGFVSIDNALYTTLAVASVTVGAASSTDRRDAIVVSQPITLAQNYVNGSGAVATASVLALSYAIPSGAQINMGNGDIATASVSSAAGATTIGINAQTPSAGTGWVASVQATPAWSVAGTANPAGGAGWTRTSSILPPIKPAVPVGAVLVGEVYVEGSGATATTQVLAGNVVDKTAPVRAVQGWVPEQNPWTRVSASVFTQSLDNSTRWAPGMRLRWSENGTVKYGLVASDDFNSSNAGKTTVTMIVNNDYSMAATPDSGSMFWCDSGTTPPDFPDWFNYIPTFTADSGTWSSVNRNPCRFRINGRTCFLNFNLLGTTSASTATMLSLTLPITSAVGANTSTIGRCADGTFQAQPAFLSMGGNATTVGILKSPASSPGTFGAGANRGGQGDIFYQF